MSPYNSNSKPFSALAGTVELTSRLISNNQKSHQLIFWTKYSVSSYVYLLYSIPLLTGYRTVH